MIDGIGPDAAMETNERGGKQSATPYRVDLIPPLAVLHVAKVSKYGAASHGVNNWHRIPSADHLNHALAHIFAHLAGDTQDDHLGHAAWRVLAALDQSLSGRDAAE